MGVKHLIRRFSLGAAPHVYMVAARIFFGTCRVEHFGEEGRRLFFDPSPTISAVWHYNILYIPWLCRGMRGVAMVSASSDGEYIARIMEGAGIDTVRGSRHRGGVPALKEMIAHMERTGGGAGIVADGSQGPPLQAQPGAVLLASRTGVPIIPLVWSCGRYMAFPSWDRTILPVPFTRMVVGYGDPLRVPASCRGEELETYRAELERRLNDLYGKAWNRFGRKGH